MTVPEEMTLFPTFPGLADATAIGEQTPTPNLPAPGFNWSGGLEDVVRPFTEGATTATMDPVSSPKLVRKKEPRVTDMVAGEEDTFDISSLFMSPSSPVFVPREEMVATMEAVVPKRSKRIAQQGDGQYIRVVDRAVQKKAREVESLGEGRQLALPQKKLKGLAPEEEGTVQPNLQVGDLLYLGKACGFTETELVKISDAAKEFEDE
jgi:hypothetical protein